MKRHLVIGTVAVALLTGCISADDPQQREKRGAAIGAAAGAVAGAIIGNQSGNNRTGAVIGAVAGAAVGGAVGRRMDAQQQELQQIEGVEVTRTAENELNIVLNNNILFDYNSSDLRPESRQTLREMADVFVRYHDTVVRVDGHTDAIGGDAFNQALSERRAGSVSRYLIDRGVEATRIQSRGFGKTMPVADNATPEGRQLNRRVEITVTSTSRDEDWREGRL
jgi:outer membrane protein OmpA-like peptidoglycan-associated protein